MATFPTTQAEEFQKKLTMDEAAAELHKIVEGYYDRMGISEEERDKHYAAAGEYLDAKNALNAKA